MFNIDTLLKETEKLNLELKKVKDDLKKAEIKYKNLLERSSDIIFVHQDGKVVLASKACAILLGAKSPKEIIGKDLLYDIVHPDYREIVKKRDYKILKKNKEVGFLEEKILKINGDVIDVDVCAVPFTYKGRPAIKVYARDLTQIKKLQEESYKNSRNLKNLNIYLQDILERERLKISHEIHDELGQMLSLLKLDVQNILTEIPRNEKNIIEKLNTMLNLINIIIERTRIISYQLRPPILDHLGLYAAIKWQIDEFSKITGIKCNLKIESEKINLNEEITIAIFRVIQEALTNILRHSKASKLWISIKKINNFITLIVRDNGIGIPKKAIHESKSFGLLSMKERISSLNGNFNIQSEENKGTTIKIKIPLKIENKND